MLWHTTDFHVKLLKAEWQKGREAADELYVEKFVLDAGYKGKIHKQQSEEKLVPWGTDGRLPLCGDFRSLILE